MKLSILIISFLLSNLSAYCQIENISNYDDLLKVQKNMKSQTTAVVVWGYFESWGKYGSAHQLACISDKSLKDFSDIKSCVSFKLFNDSTSFYLPIRESSLVIVNYREGDLIKLKIKLYRNCMMLENKIFFLIDDML